MGWILQRRGGRDRAQAMLPSSAGPLAAQEEEQRRKAGITVRRISVRARGQVLLFNNPFRRCANTRPDPATPRDPRRLLASRAGGRH